MMAVELAVFKQSIHSIAGTGGDRLTEAALRSAMGRFKQRMLAAGLQVLYWDLRDLKRKGLSDAENYRSHNFKGQSEINPYVKSTSFPYIMTGRSDNR